MTSAATTRRRSASRRLGFTLIELLVILAIIGIMTVVGILSITAGQGAARVRGATRDIFGAIRHARSTALVTCQPAVITYSTEKVDGEVVAKVEITSAKLLDAEIDRSKVQTLDGRSGKGGDVANEKGGGVELVHVRKSKAKPFAKEKGGAGESAAESKGEAFGDSIEDILFAPINTEIVKGMRLKVVMGDEAVSSISETPRKSRISVFSNVDYIIGKYNEAKKKLVNVEGSSAKPFAKTDGDGSASGGAEAGEDQEPVSVAWESNGRVEPHQVWVYPDGKKPEDGLMIRIDRFGAAKVLSGDGREEEEEK